VRTKISNHSLLVVRGAVVSSKRIENTTRGYKTFREVAKHVDVKAVFALHANGNNEKSTYDSSTTSLTGVSPLIVPSMLVGASSCACSVEGMSTLMSIRSCS
jgi:hypothetical protein